MEIEKTNRATNTAAPHTIPPSARLKFAGTAASDIPMGDARSAAFKKVVMPVLVEDMTRLLNLDETQKKAILPILETVVDYSGKIGAGLKESEKADNDYPPKIAQAVWPEFAKALGLTESDARKVQSFCKEIGKLPEVESLYCPDPKTLVPTQKKVLLNAANTFLGENVENTSFDRSFQALLPLINFSWHTTNFQRAASDETRVDPEKRDQVYNVFSDNLRFQAAKENPEEALLVMVLKDVFNYGKPSIKPLSIPGSLDVEAQAKRLEQQSAVPQTGEKQAPPGALGNFKLGE